MENQTKPLLIESDMLPTREEFDFMIDSLSGSVKQIQKEFIDTGQMEALKLLFPEKAVQIEKVFTQARTLVTKLAVLRLEAEGVEGETGRMVRFLFPNEAIAREFVDVWLASMQNEYSATRDGAIHEAWGKPENRGKYPFEFANTLPYVKDFYYDQDALLIRGTNPPA